MPSMAMLKPSKPLTSQREALASVKGFVKGFVNPFSTNNSLHFCSERMNNQADTSTAPTDMRAE
jgi:hypothetical protein